MKKYLQVSKYYKSRNFEMKKYLQVSKYYEYGNNLVSL